MNGKDILKWGLIAVALLLAWRVLSGLVNSWSSSLSSGSQQAQQPITEPIMSYWGPNGYQLGVYAPITPTWYSPGGPGVYGPWSIGYPGNPFQSSPDNPWSGRQPRPFPLNS